MGHREAVRGWVVGGLEGLRRLEATSGQAGRKALRARLVGSRGDGVAGGG